MHVSGRKAISKIQSIGIVVILVVAVVAGVYYFLSAQSTAPPQTLLLGVIGPQTGFASNLGAATFHGAEFAAYQINKSGGLEVGNQKYYVKIVIGDTRSDPNQAPNAFRSLASEGVVAVAGEALTANAVVEEPVAQQLGVPFVVGNANGVSISKAIASNNYTHVFQTSPTSTQRAGDDARSVLMYISHPAKIMIVADDSDLGRDFQSGFQAVIAQDSPSTNVQVVFTPPGATDYSAVMLKIKDFQPTMVYEVTSGISTNAFVKQEAAAGVRVLTMDGSSTPSSPTPAAWIQSMGNASLYHLTNLTWLPSENNTFATNFKTTMGYTPTLLEIQEYDAVWTTLLAIRNAGTLDHAAIAKALLHFSWKGDARGVQINFDPTTHTVPNLQTLEAQVQIVNGALQWVTIWPSQYAQSQLQMPPP